jgi:uncharacterized protein YdhG (YjbR/CyaY superfamily)
MPAPDYESVDDYIAAQPSGARPALERVRATIRKALPGAAEGISYRIPIYRIGGRMVLYFAGYQRHYSIYPATARLVSAVGKELSERLHSKATIRFSYAEPVPVRLISRISKARAAEVAEVEKGRIGRPAKKKAAGKAKAKRRKSARPR